MDPNQASVTFKFSELAEFTEFNKRSFLYIDIPV